MEIRALPQITSTPVHPFLGLEGQISESRTARRHTVVCVSSALTQTPSKSTRHDDTTATQARSKGIFDCAASFDQSIRNPNTYIRTALPAQQWFRKLHMLLLRLLCMAMAVGETAMALAPNILVLGGTGFIGSTVSRIAIESGCQVRTWCV